MSTEFSSSFKDLAANNTKYSAAFDGAGLQVRPARQLAIVACMDSRMDVFALLGLGNGEAHVIRNAGGVVTDDVIRSLCLSQRKMGTKEIILIHHTDCGLHQLSTDEFYQELEADLGIRPGFALESFTDPVADVRQSAERLRRTPFVQHTDNIRGFVYDVQTGVLNPVAVD